MNTRLYIYTDGINEATDGAGEVLGHEPVWAVIQQGEAGQTLENIVELVKILRVIQPSMMMLLWLKWCFLPWCMWTKPPTSQ